jgi:DNA-binding NarL/FixJ family response regulator
MAHATFDAIITDIVMPIRDGFEVIGAAHHHQPAARIVAMSGGGRVSRDHYLDLAAHLGAHATLPKPFDAAQLNAAVQMASSDLPPHE